MRKGPVSSRVALLLRSAEGKPFFASISQGPAAPHTRGGASQGMRPLRRAAWRTVGTSCPLSRFLVFRFFFLFLSFFLFGQGRSRVRRPRLPLDARGGQLEGTPLLGQGQVEGTQGRPWLATALGAHRRESQSCMAHARHCFAELARPAPLGGLPHDSSCGECAERQKGLEGGCFCTGGRAAGGGPRATGRGGQGRGYAA